MLLIALVSFLGTLPPASKATELARKKSWDDLLLTFAPVKPSDVSAPDGATIARALTQGCLAMENEDAVMAFDLGRHAAEMAASPDAFLCEARAARKIDQRASAEDALRRGVSRFPKDPRLLLELGRELIEQGDTHEALELLGRIPPRSPQGKAAKSLLDKAHSRARQEALALKQTGAMEQRIETGTGTDSRPTSSPPTSASFGSGTGPGDIRTRDSEYFHFKYFKNGRDFGQRAEFEGQVASALEDARRHAASILGTSRQSPVDVVLYTREEFILHFGVGMARSVAGFYQDGAIRVNGDIELTADHRATLAHEYVHAVVDELAGRRTRGIPIWMNEGLAEYVEWRFQGQDGPGLGTKTRLRSMAQRGNLPRLSSLANVPLVHTEDPGLGYAYSGLAAQFLMQQAGASAYVEALRALGRGEPLDAVFRSHLGRSVEDLERGLLADLSSR